MLDHQRVAMTWFHGLQLAYWAGAVWLAAHQIRRLMISAPLLAGPFIERVDSLLVTDPPAAMQLLRSAGDAWIGRVGLAYLEPGSGEPADGPGEAQELADNLRDRTIRGVAPLATMGRIASPLAFLGVIMELTQAFGGGRGIEALQRGLPEQLALGRAAAGVTIGVMTMIFCFSLAQMLSRQLNRLVADIGRMQSTIARPRSIRPESRET